MSKNNDTAAHYRRKCHDLAIEVKQYRTALGQINEMIDAILAQVCRTYGTEVRDEDNGDKLIGWRIEIPLPDLAGCEVRTDKRGDKYVIGAMISELPQEDKEI